MGLTLQFGDDTPREYIRAGLDLRRLELFPASLPVPLVEGALRLSIAVVAVGAELGEAAAAVAR